MVKMGLHYDGFGGFIQYWLWWNYAGYGDYNCDYTASHREQNCSEQLVNIQTVK